jgi:hypothetical protein
MKWYYKILLWVMLVGLLLEGLALIYLHNRRVYPGMPTQLSKTYYKPVAIMGINFGEKVDDFRPGQHYVLKVFYVEGKSMTSGRASIMS